MKEKSFIKVCIFFKFRRHFEISRADADFQRFRFHDVSECFITAGNYKHMRAERKYLYNKAKCLTAWCLFVQMVIGRQRGQKQAIIDCPLGHCEVFGCGIYVGKTHAVKDIHSSAASTSAQIVTKMKEQLFLALVKKAEN